MILGLGLDIVSMARIARVWEKFGIRFARKILHPYEMEQLHERSGAVQFLASRFAAKEAAVKALGTGFAQGIFPTDIRVATLADGSPSLHLYNEAGKRLHLLGANRAHISLTHDKDTVAAVVILEKTHPGPDSAIPLPEEP